jgi:hypothetical protein
MIFNVEDYEYLKKAIMKMIAFFILPLMKKLMNGKLFYL